MIIETARKEDIPELKNLWREIFKDTDDYIEKFFKYRMKSEHTFVGRENGKIISTAYMLKSDLVLNSGEVVPAFYMCGISTREEYRGKGCSGKVIEACFNHAKECGADLCYLVPANRSLFDFYKKSGMMPFTSLFKQELIVEEGNIPSYTKEFDGSKLLSLYNEMNFLFKIERTIDDFSYINKVYEILTFEDDYIIIEENDNFIYVLEQTFLSDDIAKAIAFKRNKKLVVSRPSTDENSPYTVVKILNKDIKPLNNGYINLNI